MVVGTSAAFLTMSHKVKFLVEVENFTRQPLNFVKAQMKYGGFQNMPPSVILAGNKESFNGRMISYSLDGASGAVAYRIGDSDTVIVISFDIPYWGGNNLALNFFDRSHIESMPRKSLYDQVHIEGPGKKPFNQNDDVERIEVTNGGGGEYKLNGGMGCFHSTEINVVLFPADKTNVPDKLKPGFGVEVGEEAKEESKACSII